jgi:hypothetical protein
MDRKFNSNAIAIGVIASIGFIIAALIIAGTWRNVSRSNVTITVTGSSAKDIKSDLAKWTGSFSSDAATLQEGYSKIKDSEGKVREYLTSKGIPQDKIIFSSVNTNPVFKINAEGNATEQVMGYKLTESVSIESENVDMIDKLSKESSELIMQGIEFNSMSPEFLYTKLSDLKVEMIGLASQDAKVRAEQIAKSTGNDIGEVRSSKMGVIQINAKNSTDVSDYGINDVSSIEKTIRAVVNVSFSLD